MSLSKLESMQTEFKNWLMKVKNKTDLTEIAFNNLIEKKLIEIAIKNNYKLLDRNDLLGNDDIFLVFENVENEKFITAWINEEGFDDKEVDDLW